MLATAKGPETGCQVPLVAQFVGWWRPGPAMIGHWQPQLVTLSATMSTASLAALSLVTDYVPPLVPVLHYVSAKITDGWSTVRASRTNTAAPTVAGAA